MSPLDAVKYLHAYRIATCHFQLPTFSRKLQIPRGPTCLGLQPEYLRGWVLNLFFLGGGGATVPSQ